MLSCLSRQTTDRDVRQVGEIQLNLAQVTSTTISHQSSQHCLVQGEGLFTVSRETTGRIATITSVGGLC